MNPLFHVFFQHNRYLLNRLNEVLQEQGLFNSQWTILYLLHENGPMTLTSVWKYLNVEAPTVTRTVARLETLGWVIREQGIDKREKIVTLTEYAKSNFSQIEATVLAFEAEMTNNLTESEQQHLIDLLTKMKG